MYLAVCALLSEALSLVHDPSLAWVKPQTESAGEGKLVACASFSHRLWLMLDPPHPGSRPKLTPPVTLRSTLFT